MTFPRITFGIIVLNGEPFTRYCLRSLYPFAHEIIVVEGAIPGAAESATPDGHSRDETLEVLQRFKLEEDTQNKLQIITRDGFWSEKDEQSQAYAKKATGDYLWQIDVDEFYKPDDMSVVMKLLADDPSITAMSFKQITFWGGFDYTVDGIYLRQGAAIYHRLFKWGEGYRYITHRPPTVHDPQGRDQRTLHWLTAKETTRQGIFLYHYSLLFPKQVFEKCNYYEKAGWLPDVDSREWVEQSFMRLRKPYMVHNVYQYPSWLERFHGQHPAQITMMRDDLHAGRLLTQMRHTDDIDRLLQLPRYKLGRAFLKFMAKWDDRFIWGRRLQSLMTDPLNMISRRFKITR